MKDKLSLEVRVDSRGGGSEVRLTPKGLMWEEDDQPTPKGLPLPKDATDVEYDDFFESIKFKSPSNVKDLAEFLAQELGERKWTKDATEFDLATFVRMKFTQGKSSLTIDIRTEEDSTREVDIRTKGMQWDGMKAQIERTKKESQKTAAELNHPKKGTNDKPLELPKRKDKPRQGIDKLAKLPSKGTVVMDGKTHQCPGMSSRTKTSRTTNGVRKSWRLRNQNQTTILASQISSRQAPSKNAKGNVSDVARTVPAGRAG